MEIYERGYTNANGVAIMYIYVRGCTNVNASNGFHLEILSIESDIPMPIKGSNCCTKRNREYSHRNYLNSISYLLMP